MNDKKSSELSFTVPWGVIAAKAWGDPRHLPVLMIHGIQDNACAFDRIMPFLPNGFYYVNIDLPGHGKSSEFPKGVYLDFMLYISAIHRVIKQLNWSKFYYIGHSLGGQLGYYYSAIYSEEVKKLVVIDTLGLVSIPLDDFVNYHKNYLKNLMEIEDKLLKQTSPMYTYEEALNKLISRRPSPINEEAAKALLKRSLKQNNHAYCFSMDQRLKAGVKTHVTTEQHINILLKIQCPVLLVITNNLLDCVSKNVETDNSFSKTLELFKMKKNFHLVAVEGHHDVHNNEPDVVAPHISRFILQQNSVL